MHLGLLCCDCFLELPATSVPDEFNVTFQNSNIDVPGVGGRHNLNFLWSLHNSQIYSGLAGTLIQYQEHS